MFWLFWQIVGVFIALMAIGLVAQLCEGIVETCRDYRRWREAKAEAKAEARVAARRHRGVSSQG